MVCGNNQVKYRTRCVTTSGVSTVLNASIEALVASPLADLRSHLSSLDPKSDNAFQPQRKIPFSSVTPNHLLFALNDTRLVVGLTHGPVIVFEASSICSPGDNEVTALHTFLSTTPTPTAVRQMYANPGDIPEVVAILREPDGSPNSQLVEVINVSTMQSVAGWSTGGTPETFPTSSTYNPLFSVGISLSVSLIVSWSPKGKQLAIALQSGDIITFSPSGTQQAKSFVTRPPSMQGQSIIHATWLSNPAFYTIFAPAGPLDPQVDQKHMVIVHDAKRPDTSADVFLPINFFPSGIRPPGAFTISLRGWDPAKILLLVGDSTTADIGLVCCTTDDKWQKLAFDESAPSMPLDADQNETTMIGFELDLKNTTSYDVTTSTGETVSVPPPPVVWAYASDGTITAWYVVNTRGTPYPSMGQVATLSPVTAPAGPVATSPFSQAAQPAFGQTSPSTFGQSSQPSLAFGSSGPTFGQPAFGQASMTGSAFGQRPTFGNPGFAQTSSSAFGQPSSSGQAPSGEGFASFASAPVKWGQSNFGSTVSSFTSAAPPASSPQLQPSESTESMSTDSGQELSFSGMSLGEGTNDTQPKAGSGMTGMFGSPAPATQSTTPATTSAFGSGSFISPGVGAFAKFVPRETSDTSNAPTVEVPKPSPAFGQSGFGAPAFGQSGFGQSAFGKTGLGTPMSTTPIVTPVSTTSPSFGSGEAFSAFASGGSATLSGSKPAETKLATPTVSGGGGFGGFASGGPSAFGQAASTTAESVPAWKTGGDATFGSGTGSSVFGGTSSTTPAKSLFSSAEPAPSTTHAFSPPTTSSPEKAAPSSAGATPLTPPFDRATPPRGSQSPPDDSTARTSPLITADSAKSTVPPSSTTPAGPPPVPNAFTGLRMSTGFGLSNFNAKDSPFANPKPVSQTVSAFGGGQPSVPKMPVPATPGSVFGQTSTVGTAAKPVSASGQPAFGSPSTPTAAASTTPSSSQTGSSNAFSAFSGVSSAFGKGAGSGMSFSDMLRDAGSSPDSKSREAQAKASSKTVPTPPTPKSVFDKSPTPRPASIPAAPDSEDEGEGEKEKDGARQVVSAASSFSNLSSSTSSFVDVPRGGEEEEEEEEEGAVASDGGDGEQQIDEFLSDTDSEGEAHEEEQEVEGPEEGEEHEEEEEEEEEQEQEQEAPESDEEENKLPTPPEADPTVVPLPKSRSPSSTPKAERPVINVQPTFPPKPDSEPEPSSTSSARSTTPPGSPPEAQTPLQEPTPTLPSPSESPSPSPSSTSSGLGRPSTRPLRSSPLANAPVSGGEEEEVKGEQPASLKPRPASPKTPFGQWDGGANAPSPTPPLIKLEASVDQTAAKAAPPSMIPIPITPPLLPTKETPPNNKPTSSLVTGATVTPPPPTSGWIPRPITPPLLPTKGTPPNNEPTSSLATGATVMPPPPTSGWIGFSHSGAASKPDTKSTAEDATKPATTTPPSLFAGIKPGVFSLMPKPEAGTEAPATLDSKAVPRPLFGTKPPAVPGTTLPRLPLAPATGPSLDNLPGAIPGATTPATPNNVLTSSRTLGAISLVTPPKETPSTEPMHPMQREFMTLYTEVKTEMIAVS
jgi:nucleoporin NUP159